MKPILLVWSPIAVIAAITPLLVADADAAATRVFTGIDVRSGGDGYLLSSARGEMYAFGGAAAVRNPAGFTGDIADVALTSDGKGAMAVSSAGQFYASGTATAQRNPSGFAAAATHRTVVVARRTWWNVWSGDPRPALPASGATASVRVELCQLIERSAHARLDRPTVVPVRHRHDSPSTN